MTRSIRGGITLFLVLVLLFTSTAEILETVQASAAEPLAPDSVKADTSTAGPLAPDSVKVDTYGKAWEGYYAFGLFHMVPNQLGVWNRSFLAIMNSKGELVQIRNDEGMSYEDVESIAPNTLMFQGEPLDHIHFLNLVSNTTTEFPGELAGHHDVEYNPVTNTFLTLRGETKMIGNMNVGYDRLVEFNSNASILWSWNTLDHFDLSERCPYEAVPQSNQTPYDFTLTNTVYWNQSVNVVYLNIRNLNTFCKINKTNGQLLWSIGGYGNFTLLGANGSRVRNLWYHSHAVKQVGPNVFSMFDNDFHNQTDPTSRRSRMIEVTVNEKNMTAWVSWSWTAPPSFWSPYWGDADRLPNGDRIGTFGTETHFLSNSSGAILAEVNEKGVLVRTYTFPASWGIYRIQPMVLPPALNPLLLSDYDTLNLSPATLSDWTAAAYLYKTLTNASQGLDTDTDLIGLNPQTNLLNQTSGQPLGGPGPGIITFGGPTVNPLVKYAESETTPREDRAPVKTGVDAAGYHFEHADGTVIQGTNMSRQLLNKNRDLFVIELYQNHASRNILLSYGFSWKGTYAAGKYLSSTIYANLAAFPYRWLIVKWEDTNGNGFADSPRDGDTYTIVATDPNIAYHEAAKNKIQQGKTWSPVKDNTAWADTCMTAFRTAPNGKALYGPYIFRGEDRRPLANKIYVVHYRLKSTSNDLPLDVATIDVTYNLNSTIVKKTIKASDFHAPNTWQSFQLTFTAPASLNYGIEFRIINLNNGITDLSVDSILVERTP